MLNFENFINYLFAGFISCYAWFLKQLHSNNHQINQSVKDIERSLPEKYVMKADFRDYKHELFERLDRIENKIDYRR